MSEFNPPTPVKPFPVPEVTEGILIPVPLSLLQATVNYLRRQPWEDVNDILVGLKIAGDKEQQAQIQRAK